MKSYEENNTKLLQVMDWNRRSDRGVKEVVIGYTLSRAIVDESMAGSLSDLAQTSDLKAGIRLMVSSSKLAIEIKQAVIQLVEESTYSNSKLAELLVTFKSLEYSLEDLERGMSALFQVLDELTASSVNELMLRLLNPTSGDFYDGTFGLGGTLIEAHQYANSVGGSLCLYGQELDEMNYYLGILRCYVLGISAQLKKGDVLKIPAFTKSDSTLKQFDYVAMHSPWGTYSEPVQLFENDDFGRFIYGLPGRANQEFLFLSHALRSLKPKGKAAFILPNGALFKGGVEGRIRKNIVAADLVEAVIALPDQVLTNTPLQFSLVIFNLNKEAKRKQKILFIDAKPLVEVNRRTRYLSEQAQQQIVSVYEKFENVEDFSQVVEVSNLKEANLLASEYLVKKGMEIEGFGWVNFDLEQAQKLANQMTLADKVMPYRGISLTSRHEPSENGEYAVINLSNVKDGKINVTELERYDFSEQTRVDSYLAKEGDLIVSCRGAQLKLAVVPKSDVPLVLSHNFIGLRMNEDVDVNYLKAYLESPIGQYLIQQKRTGTNVLTLNSRQLLEVPVILPTLNQQQQIIKAHENKKAKLEAQIQQLKQQLKQNELDLFQEMGLSNVMQIL